MKLPEDNQIINAVLNGNVNAYGRIVRKYQKSIYNLMYRATKSEQLSMEMAQETFTRAYEKLERFNPGRSFFSWLYAIGANLARDHLRKAGRELLFSEAEIDANQLMDSGPNQEPHLEYDVEITQVMQLLEKLPLDYREALILRYREDLSLEEVGKALSISTSGAKMRVHRALKSLRSMLAVIGEPSPSEPLGRPANKHEDQKHR